MTPPSPRQQRRLEAQLHLLQSLRAAGGNRSTPCFAHLRLRTAVREVDVLLSNTSRTLPGLSLVDWQTAPLAEVFFTCSEGEEYEVDTGSLTVSGTLLEKHLLTFSRGELVRLEWAEGTLARREDGTWEAVVDAGAPPLEPRPPALRRPFRSPLEVTLDPAQQALVDLPAGQSVLILGEAGFGKTTVALHRLAALQEAAEPGWRGAVIVPTEGLRRLTRLMLDRRGVPGVDVWTYDAWAGQLARRSFPDLPARESVGTPAAVIQLKRHPALRPVLEDFVRQRPRPTVDEDRPTRSRARARRADLEQLFGDRGWMERVAGAAAVAAVLAHTRAQFRDTTEAEFAEVRRGRLAAVDGNRIDAGTTLEDADSADAEDCAVLFELERLRAAAAGVPPLGLAMYHCVLVDEAQEFAPLELSLMGRAVGPGGTVIAAGDAAQQVDPTASFSGWDAALAALGTPDAVRAGMEVNYRCPPDVTALARSVLDPREAPARREPSVLRALHPDLFHQAVWLAAGLRILAAEDPSASVAVICRSPEAARSFARMLRHGLTPRLALDGAFDFRPGVLLTCVQEVKGLEFDCVVVPDATAATYPDTPESRRALYVAVTRATHRLTLTAAGRWTPLLT